MAKKKKSNFGARMAALRGGKKGGKGKVKLPSEGMAVDKGGMYADKMKKTKKKNWIAGAIKRPGALHRALGVKAGRKIPAGKLRTAAGKKGRVGAEARLATTLGGFHKRDASQKAYLKRVGGRK